MIFYGPGCPGNHLAFRVRGNIAAGWSVGIFGYRLFGLAKGCGGVFDFRHNVFPREREFLQVVLRQAPLSYHISGLGSIVRIRPWPEDPARWIWPLPGSQPVS
jgi:hypothetical protein